MTLWLVGELLNRYFKLQIKMTSSSYYNLNIDATIIKIRKKIAKYSFIISFYFSIEFILRVWNFKSSGFYLICISQIYFFNRNLLSCKYNPNLFIILSNEWYG